MYLSPVGRSAKMPAALFHHSLALLQHEKSKVANLLSRSFL
jgi:hypothetical protein